VPCGSTDRTQVGVPQPASDTAATATSTRREVGRPLIESRPVSGPTIDAPASCPVRLSKAKPK
jgi:hypothetical protein